MRSLGFLPGPGVLPTEGYLQSATKTGHKHRAKRKAVFLISRQRQLPDTPPYSASDPRSPPQVKGESIHIVPLPWLTQAWVARMRGTCRSCLPPQVHAAGPRDLLQGGSQLPSSTPAQHPGLCLSIHSRACPAAFRMATRSPVTPPPPGTKPDPPDWG